MGERDRQTDRHTDRDREREREREKKKKKKKQICTKLNTCRLRKNLFMG